MAITRINPRILVILILTAAALAAWNGPVAFSADGDTSDWIWVPTDLLLHARNDPTATLVELPEGGRGVLLVGGQNATSTSSAPNFLNSSELYDVDKKRFVPGQPSMKVPRMWHTATLLANRKVLVVAGQTVTFGPVTVKSCELFDPSNRALGWQDGGELSEFRHHHTATLLTAEGPNQNKVLVAGGEQMLPPDPPKTLDSSELYDPGTNSWTKTQGSLAQARESHTATLLTRGSDAGKILVVGGFYLFSTGPSQSPKRLATPTCELYNPETYSWENATALNYARGSHTATLLSDGKILVAGGEDQNGTLRSYEIYDPYTKSWTANPNRKGLPVPCSQHTATQLKDDLVLLTGGSVDPYTTQIYSHKTKSWALAYEFLSFPRNMHTATRLNIDGWVLVAGGVPNKCELYRPPSAIFKSGVFRLHRKPLTSD